MDVMLLTKCNEKRSRLATLCPLDCNHDSLLFVFPVFCYFHTSNCADMVYTYYTLAKGPDVARGKKIVLKSRKKIFEKRKILNFFSLKHPPTTYECPQKISAHSVQPFGCLLVTIYECL